MVPQTVGVQGSRCQPLDETGVWDSATKQTGCLRPATGESHRVCVCSTSGIQSWSDRKKAKDQA